jgi:type IV pilus assembly protein PilQ
MSKKGMFFLAAVAALGVAAGAPRTAAGVSPGTDTAMSAPGDLRDVIVSSDRDGHTVVTLAADGRLAYESQVLENPQRLVVDLKGAVSRLQTRQIEVGKGGVSRVRAGQYRTEPEPVSRVVFDLEKEVPYRIEETAKSLVVTFGADAPAPAAKAIPVAVASPAEAPKPAPVAVPARENASSTSAIPVAVASATSAPAPASPITPKAAPVASAPVEPAPAPKAEPAAPTAPKAIPVASGPNPVSIAAPAMPPPKSERAPSAEAIDRVLRAPAQAAPAESASFETKTIMTDSVHYSGKRISLNLVDADVKQVFRLFHEISGLNFVLDPSVEGRVTIVLDNVPWDQALDIILKNNGLDKVLENNVVRIATTPKLASEAAARKQLKEAKELEVEPITITRTLSYAKAKEVERVIRDGGVLTPRGKVIVDERTNTLIISDVPKKVDPLDTLISTLDSETPQVMIEARIVETSREFVQDFGVNWGFTAAADAAHGTQTDLAFPHNASVSYGLNLPGAGSASNLAFSFGNVIDSFTLDIALNALETEGRGRILSSPKIATQNNERAEIEQGVRIPVVNTTATEINVEFVSASLRLAVTPQITAEGTIVLDIQVENNSPDFVNTVGDTPPINTQRATTKVLITDGGTAVIGGIFTVNEAQSETGVPWFRKIPVLGWLFKTRNITNENRELLIFITPKIMKLS